MGRYSPTKLCDGAHMAIFGDFFASCVFSELRAAGFRPASKIRTKATPCTCGSMADIQSAAAEIGRGKKEKRRKKNKLQHENIYGLPYSIGRP